MLVVSAPQSIRRLPVDMAKMITYNISKLTECHLAYYWTNSGTI